MSSSRRTALVGLSTAALGLTSRGDPIAATAVWAAAVRGGVLPVLPEPAGVPVAALLGFALTFSLGVARVHRTDLPRKLAVGDGLGLLVVVCLFGGVLGIVLPTGWSVLTADPLAALVRGVVALALGVAANLLSGGVVSMVWLDYDVDQQTSPRWVRVGILALGSLVAPLVPVVLSSLTYSHTLWYVVGLLVGATAVVPWALFVGFVGPLARRLLSAASLLAGGTGSALWLIFGYPYRRYRARREERRKRAKRQIDEARAMVDGVESQLESMADGVDRPPVARAVIESALDRLDAGDYDQARSLAEDATDVAERERAVRARLESVTNRDIEGPERDPERVEDLLEGARSQIEAGELEDAAESIDRAERLAGPEVTYLMDRARSVADEAREADDLDRKLEKWERAEELYGEALDRAHELEEGDLADRIAETVDDVEVRREAVRKKRERTRFEDAASDAWKAVLAGDELLHDDPDAAREAYGRAVDQYRASLEFGGTRGDDVTDRVETAVEFLKAACEECRIVLLRERLRDALAHLDEPDRAREDLEDVLTELDDLDVDARTTRDVAARGRARLELDHVREAMAAAESRFREGNYYGASEAVRGVREAGSEAASTVSDLGVEPAAEELERLSERYEALEDAIERTLTDVDETPSITPVEEVDRTFGVAPEDVPSGEDHLGHVPAADRLAKTVGPGGRRDRRAFEEAAETFRRDDLAASVEADLLDRIEDAVREREGNDPIVDARSVDEREDELREAATAVVAELESKLSDAVASRESDPPEGHRDIPPAADEEFAASLRETGSLDAFASRWETAVDRLTDALEGVR